MAVYDLDNGWMDGWMDGGIVHRLGSSDWFLVSNSLIGNTVTRNFIKTCIFVDEESSMLLSS